MLATFYMQILKLVGISASVSYGLVTVYQDTYCLSSRYSIYLYLWGFARAHLLDTARLQKNFTHYVCERSHSLTKIARIVIFIQKFKSAIFETMSVG